MRRLPATVPISAGSTSACSASAVSPNRARASGRPATVRFGPAIVIPSKTSSTPDTPPTIFAAARAFCWSTAWSSP